MGGKIWHRKGQQVSSQLWRQRYLQIDSQLFVYLCHYWHFPPRDHLGEKGQFFSWSFKMNWCQPHTLLSAVQPAPSWDLDKQGEGTLWVGGVNTQACDRKCSWLRGLLVHFYIITGQYVQILRRGVSLPMSTLLEMHICNKGDAMNRLKKGDKVEGDLWDELGG